MCFTNASAQPSLGGLSRLKLRDRKPGLELFFTPRGSKPACNNNCRECYFFSNYKEGQDALPASEVPPAVSSLRGKGYEKFYLTTSELLLAPNWRDIIAASNDKYIQTNGLLISKYGQPLLEQISNAGVRQLVITSNAPGYFEQLRLAPEAAVLEAFKQVNEFNLRNPQAPFSTVATAIINSQMNLMWKFPIRDLCSYVKEVYKANAVKFISLIPFSKESIALSPSPMQLSLAAAEIKLLRETVWPKEELYIQRGGTLGGSWLGKEKKRSLCPAGKSLFGVRWLTDGAPVTPCIFLPKITIGTMQNGKIKLDWLELLRFLSFKRKSLERELCPAYASWRYFGGKTGNMKKAKEV